MTNIEHYFENLLYESYENPEDDINRTLMTEDEINAVKICADYIKYSLFDSLDDFRFFRKTHKIMSAEKTGEWLIPQRRGVMSWNEKAYAECSVCHEVIFNARSMKFCPQCGAMMVEE